MKRSALKGIATSGMIVLSFGLLLACGSSGHALRGGTAPAWANRAPGGWMCTLDGKAGFCSMGMVSGIRGDAAMRRTAAAERARVGLQRLFDTYSASLFKSYQAATTDFRDAAEEQHLEQAMKTFSAGHLSGVEIRDYWEDEKDNGYALAFLSLDDFTQAMDKMGNLNQKTKQFIRNNAERLHEELRQEEERRNAQ